ncbi:MAG: hypothetical protein H6797_05225 [Candidatus Nomurabacteria bacterium]|nr:MAG: hypothetical protein H6797_05225 [Candidatus Nomurabacteria bacterium]
MNIKQTIIGSVNEVVKDRYIAVLLFVFLLVCAGVIVFLLSQIHPSELQVVVHYTGFGPTNFYRDKWYYLLTFVAYVIVLAVVHSMTSYKLLQKKGRDFTAAFIWFSIILILVAATIFYQILKIASLS